VQASMVTSERWKIVYVSQNAAVAHI